MTHPLHAPVAEGEAHTADLFLQGDGGNRSRASAGGTGGGLGSGRVGDAFLA